VQQSAWWLHQTGAPEVILLLVVLVMFVGLLAWAGITAVEEQTHRQRRIARDLDMKKR
jgi:hypothetical protein